jgi:hypothetical protein
MLQLPVIGLEIQISQNLFDQGVGIDGCYIYNFISPKHMAATRKENSKRVKRSDNSFTRLK